MLVSAHSFADELSAKAKGVLELRDSLIDAGTALVFLVPAAVSNEYWRTNSFATTMKGVVVSAAAHEAAKALKPEIQESRFALRKATTFTWPSELTVATGTALALSTIVYFKGTYYVGHREASIGTKLSHAGGIVGVYMLRQSVEDYLKRINVPHSDSKSVTAFVFTSAGALAMAYTNPGTVTGVIAQTLTEAGAFTAITPVIQSGEAFIHAYLPEAKIPDAFKPFALWGLGYWLSRLATPQTHFLGLTTDAYVHHRVMRAISTALFLAPAYELLAQSKHYAPQISDLLTGFTQKSEL
jgi:hypothetical protein